MRNLKVLLNIKYQNKLLAESDLIVFGKHQQTGDLSSKLNEIFCLSNNLLYSIHLDRDEVLQKFDFKKHFGNKGTLNAVGMWYRDLSEKLTVCFDNGEIISLYFGPRGAVITDIPLFICAIHQVHWSPDEEFAVLVSSNNKLLLIGSDYMTIAEIDLLDTAAGEKQLINVGWGKKETQFHGSEGKKAALAGSVPVNITPSEVSRSLQLTWRGDSNLFAVGYWCPEKNMRRVKIFNNEGDLQCISEEIQGLEEPLFWKPQGNLITFSEQLPNKLVIGFMEKNGLKHGDFTIPSNLKVKDICWNETSSILCTVCVNKETEEEEILLWTTGNYHWYLKQKFQLKTPLKKVWWDKERPNRLYILKKNGDFHILEWTFEVVSSYFSSCEELANVAVIDSDHILITSFKNAVIPPPLCSYRLKCPDTVNQVIFAPVKSEDCPHEFLLCAVLGNGSIAVFIESSSEPLVISGIADRPDFPAEILSMGQWEWVNRNTFLLCYSEKNMSTIHHFLLEGSHLSLRNTVTFEGNIITCARSNEKAVIQTLQGKIMNYDVENMTISSEGFSFAEPCSFVKNHATGVYSLSDWGRFYVNGSQISLPSLSGNVTSFFIRDPYILLTTSSHKLFILHFDYKIAGHEASERKLERGSRLVIVSGNLVILQAPRGNLETIQPRALTVSTAGELIDKKLYKDAICLLRKQRINLNLLADHDLNSFLDNAECFIEQVDPQWITLFITELVDHDVIEESYKHCYNTKTRRVVNMPGTKIKNVCQLLVRAMSSDDEKKKKYILPILSALVKMDQIGEAIKLANSEQALQHLMFIVDVNKLYLEALGTYDLQAALKIAQKTQRDPKEYVPYLNSLREMETNYMKFTIDKKLNRFQSALQHLSQCSEEHTNEFYDFIEENTLYDLAVAEFSNDNDRIGRLSLMLAEHLFKKKDYEKSGHMYLSGGDLEKAMECFIKVGNWKQCLSIAKKANYSDENCAEVVEKICGVLVSNHRFRDAAYMYLEWVVNVEKAINLYIQGKCWKEAVYAAENYNKLHFMSVIKETLLEDSELLLETINENCKKMETYTLRLEKVRAGKRNKPPGYIYDDFSDTASETSSTSSFRTKSFQSRSSKNTKKMNRKMWSLKEGHPREEEALVATLDAIIIYSERCADEVNISCSVLQTFNEKEVANKLETTMNSWLKMVEDSKKVIWPEGQEVIETELCDNTLELPRHGTIVNVYSHKT